MATISKGLPAGARGASPQRREKRRDESGITSKTPRLIGWQGVTVHVPQEWDLTAFSGTDQSGYFRVDDSDENALEVKWGTEAKKTKSEPDPEVKRDSFFSNLRQTSKKKKMPLETSETVALRGLQKPDRNLAGFSWVGDRKAIGAVWYCRTCRRVVIAQVLGAKSGRGGLMGMADAILATLKCHSDDPEWRTWALYDLVTEVPTEYQLVSQQLMNVYLRLSFARKTARLSVEQWALANVARRDAYLDDWVRANAKGELREARWGEPGETEVQGHPALTLSGGPGFGLPMAAVVREVSRFHRPATRFTATAWDCERSNKLYLVEAIRPRNAADPVPEIARRTRCHGAGSSGSDRDNSGEGSGT